MKSRLKIKTEQQPDATWKAWHIGGHLVVHAETEEKAVDIVKMFLKEDEKGQGKDPDMPYQEG